MRQRSEVNHLFVSHKSRLLSVYSWSRSGRFLASGSDDTWLNIWSYNPDSMAKPFTLNTSILTGHTANIFSTAFLPHSNDRTLVTCAGDSQVRVFDLEGNVNNSSRDAEPGPLDTTRSRRFLDFFSNAKFLNNGNTKTKVYRSHADRVKRIVTESSPYTFLTCSEDGEVRQWDIRQPSSAYPAPRSGQGFRHSRPGTGYDADVPPPLISYKKYSLDLNSISCAPTQPHYIALGGAHLHCFLHDRRMLGRDVAAERGQSPGSLPRVGSHDDDMMDQATRCVRRFAPNDKFAMSRHDNGHITSCKISNANPNVLVGSWSGDHIYSFDIVQSPDVREAGLRKEQALRQNHGAARQQRNRKRKRAKAASSQNGEEDVSLRVRYGNGQTEIIPIDQAERDVARSGATHDNLLTEAQKLSQRIARSLVQLRKSLFDFEADLQHAAVEDSSQLTPHTAVFTTVLGQAAALLPQIDDVIVNWGYPLDASPETVRLQNTLKRNRQACRRFVQASGCLAAAMGGRLQTLSPMPDPRMSVFDCIEPAQREGISIDENQRFCYDFLKAILFWLRSDEEALVNAFQKPPDRFRDSQRFPLAPGDGFEAIDKKLIKYLSKLARDDKPILNVDANRFETEESRTVFENQTVAVNAFARAMRDFRLSSRSAGISPQPSASATSEQTMDLGAACRFWGVRVGRSLLMDAGKGCNFEFVNRAFGGLRISVLENIPTSRQEEVDEDDESIEAIDVLGNVDAVAHPALAQSSDSADVPLSLPESPEAAIQTNAESTNQDTIMTGSREAIVGVEVADEAQYDDDDYDDASSSGAEREESDDDDTGPGRPLYRRAIGFGASTERAKVEMDKPYSSHTRVYKGHCNVKTVKDVNFYGLDDEFVVSGSDDGHVFIWDRKTTQLVNILAGDGEIVNVIQPHPYEPLLAVSGIDSTIKLFSPDERLQEDARQGTNIANPSDGAAMHSSLRVGGPRRRVSQPADAPTVAGLTSRKAMHNSCEIMSQNEVQRRDGTSDAFLTVSAANHITFLPIICLMLD
jgi:DDB1- and CUL4-associated factor 6